jgi:16S rRNA processing protein RimM
MPQDIPDGYVAIARVLGAWGVRGDVKAEVMAPDAVLTKGRTVWVRGQQTTILQASRNGDKVRLVFEGIDSREAAAEMRGEWVLARQSDLPTMPEGEYYRIQLLGLRVVSTEGQELGTIEDVFSTRENDVYVARGEAGEVLVPAIDDVVVGIDLEKRVVTVEVIPGLLP